MVKPTVGRGLLRSALLGLLVATLAVLVNGTELFRAFELRTVDLRFRLRGSRPVKTPIAVVFIGEDSIAAYGRWPWSWDYHALLIDALQRAGARLVLFDILFAEAPSRLDGQLLAAAARQAGNVQFISSFARLVPPGPTADDRLLHRGRPHRTSGGGERGGRRRRARQRDPRRRRRHATDSARGAPRRRALPGGLAARGRGRARRPLGLGPGHRARRPRAAPAREAAGPDPGRCRRHDPGRFRRRARGLSRAILLPADPRGRRAPGRRGGRSLPPQGPHRDRRRDLRGQRRPAADAVLDDLPDVSDPGDDDRQHPARRVSPAAAGVGRPRRLPAARGRPRRADLQLQARGEPRAHRARRERVRGVRGGRFHARGLARAARGAAHRDSRGLRARDHRPVRRGARGEDPGLRAAQVPRAPRRVRRGGDLQLRPDRHDRQLERRRHASLRLDEARGARPALELPAHRRGARTRRGGARAPGVRRGAEELRDPPRREGRPRDTRGDRLLRDPRLRGHGRRHLGDLAGSDREEAHDRRCSSSRRSSRRSGGWARASCTRSRTR